MWCKKCHICWVDKPKKIGHHSVVLCEKCRVEYALAYYEIEKKLKLYKGESNV